MTALQPTPEESLDALVGDWRIFQLRRGHRFSTDDLVTAWRGAAARPDARRYLDIGCGIASVGLTALHMLEDATMVGVEAQEISVGLARRSVRLNGLEDRVRIVHADLRDVVLEGTFDLITGSPPYIPLGKGVVSPVAQRAGARMELRGSVYDYCAAARRFLAPGGRFCFVMAAADERTEDAPTRHGLQVVERYDYVFRTGRASHIATLVCARVEDAPLPARREHAMVIRDADGQWTPEYHAFRAAVSAPPLVR